MRGPKLLNPLVPLALAALTLAGPWAAEGPAEGSGAAPAAVTWGQLRPHLAAAFFAVRESPHRWGITALPGDLPADPAERKLREIAVEILGASHDDIAWIAGEALDHRLVVSRPMAPGETLKPLPQYVDALFDDVEVTSAVRRFAEAVLRSRGMTCADCLEGLPPARDVSWPKVREYIEDFIHVSEVTPEGRVNLHVATMENRIPDFNQCHHDLAAAVYAALHGAFRSSPAMMQAVQVDLNAELLDHGEAPRPELLRILNEGLPERVVKDPACLGPILARLPEALERHSLHCVDCPVAR
ncbi:MAG: hypothetical protein HY049_16665 [Acidobacteria bacterium]|nr:hypothetical protein [Acidobacteriota bacterium]